MNMKTCDYNIRSGQHEAIGEEREILSVLAGLQVMRYQERRVRKRGVVEYVGKKPAVR